MRQSDTAWRATLVAVLLLAFALRIYKLGAQSLWYDEAVTAQVAGRGIVELTRWTAEDIQPPLYYYVVGGWTRLLGRDEWMLRFPSAFAAALTVPVLAVLALRLFGRRELGYPASLAVAVLAALLPMYVYFAQEARMYAQLTLLGALAGYFLLRATASEDRRRSIGWWAAFVLAALAMLYTHYFGLFLLLAYALCLAVSWLPAIRNPAAPNPVSASPARGKGTPNPCNPVGAGGTGSSSGSSTRAHISRQFVPALISAGLIALFYVPWLPAMLSRYRMDRSYWQGALKLGEALRHVAVSFTTGAPETMLESDAIRLLPWFGLSFGVAIGALAWVGRSLAPPPERAGGLRTIQALAWLLITLIVPVVAILALASRTPKFNARYLIISTPAYLLILAGGIAALVTAARIRFAGESAVFPSEGSDDRLSNLPERSWTRAPRNAHLPGGRGTALCGAMLSAVALGLAGFLVVASGAGIRNWFMDPAFTKAQWRELAASVRARIAPDEAVLLVSGHSWPAWEYYAPDIPAVRLPEIDILDVNAVLGFKDGAALNEALRGKAGAWVVSWQEEAVDPAGFLPFFLGGVGRERPAPQGFWHLKLQHWSLPPDVAFTVEPQPAHTDGANYAHQVALLGWDDPQAGEMTLYWRALNPITRDYQVSLVLEDASGKEVGRWDGRPAGYGYPTFRWRLGESVFGRYSLPVPPDAEPGEYYVTIALYDSADPSGLDIMDVADNPAGKRVRLGPLRLGG